MTRDQRPEEERLHLVEELVEDLAEEHTNWIPIIAAVVASLSIVAMVLLVRPLREAATDALSGDTASLRSDLKDFGAGGVILVLVLAVSHAVVFYPAEILNAAVGFVYGVWFGFPLMMLGWLLNGVLCHQVGRHAARPALMRMFGAERFGRYERIIERGGVTLLLVCRMVPIVPFSLFSYVAGSARVPLSAFVWTTMVGYTPLTLLFVYLGSRLEELSLTDPAIWIGAAALVFFVVLTRRVMPTLKHGGDDPGSVPSEPEPTEPESDTSPAPAAPVDRS